MTAEKRESRANVTVLLEDVNDNWPHFVETSYEIMIAENSPKDTSVITVQVNTSFTIQPDIDTHLCSLLNLIRANTKDFLHKCTFKVEKHDI